MINPSKPTELQSPGQVGIASEVSVDTDAKRLTPVQRDFAKVLGRLLAQEWNCEQRESQRKKT